MALILVDTNILVYAHDASEAAKQARAIEVLAGLRASGQGRLSTQVAAEFFAAMTQGRRPRLRAGDAARQTQNLLRSWRVLEVTPFVVLEALRGVTIHGMSYWDAQLWATARLNQVPVIFSEDFNTGAVLEGVRFVDPLARDFDPAAWI